MTLDEIRQAFNKLRDTWTAQKDGARLDMYVSYLGMLADRAVSLGGHGLAADCRRLSERINEEINNLKGESSGRRA